ncbi:MAG TPA: peptidase M23 [Bacteroidales bacterium]|jgi:murein DD-endopeptidase MepM/ murein hydrolase activator NlpD|nr:peptidase M23 [Bacteroidales bacterium]
MDKSAHIINILKGNRDFFARIIDVELNDNNVYVFDFSDKNMDLYKIDLNSTEAFTEYVFNTLKKENKKVGVGGYMEDRLIYKRSIHFDNEGEPRSIHLGVDLWIEKGTAVYSPLPGIVHSFKVNEAFGDYGPTLILEHLIDNTKFYTLYGHLSLVSLRDKKKGQQIRRGDLIASIGDEKVNGNWPPHLHFQIITDMLGNEGDFPGVAPPSAKEYFRNLCIDPNLILKINKLKKKSP